MKEKSASKTDRSWIVRFWVIFGFVMLLVAVALGPICPPACGKRSIQSATMQKSHAIGLALSSYANDHDGHYPEGKSSTEVFQQLVDGGYVSDSQLFYLEHLHLPGKSAPINDHLKSENVCWDVTCCVDSSTPGGLPVVFVAGYKVSYQAGAKAMLIEPPKERTWSQWWNGVDIPLPFIAVCHKDNSALVMLPNQDGSIPNFIPADFDPKGKTYRQLTP